MADGRGHRARARARPAHRGPDAGRPRRGAPPAPRRRDPGRARGGPHLVRPGAQPVPGRARPGRAGRWAAGRADRRPAAGAEPSTADPLLVALRDWRRDAARAARIDEQAVADDRTLAAIAARALRRSRRSARCPGSARSWRDATGLACWPRSLPASLGPSRRVRLSADRSAVAAARHLRPVAGAHVVDRSRCGPRAARGARRVQIRVVPTGRTWRTHVRTRSRPGPGRTWSRTGQTERAAVGAARPSRFDPVPVVVLGQVADLVLGRGRHGLHVREGGRRCRGDRDVRVGDRAGAGGAPAIGPPAEDEEGRDEVVRAGVAAPEEVAWGPFGCITRSPSARRPNAETPLP